MLQISRYSHSLKYIKLYYDCLIDKTLVVKISYAMTTVYPTIVISHFQIA